MRKIMFLFSFLASLVVCAQDGSLDMSFNVQGQVSPETILKLQPDGKILLIERFIGDSDLVESTKISRLNLDGSFDLTFAQGIGISVSPEVKAVAMQSDGKIILGGNILKVENEIVGNLARLNPDGSLDTSFSEMNLGNIEAIAVQSDDKILIGGGFVNGIVRLYANGDLDPFFNSPVDVPSLNGANSSFVSNIVLHENNILVVGNAFIEGNMRRIFSLKSDGELNTTFQEPSNIDWADGDSWSPKFLTTEKSGNILIGWPFKVFTDSENTIGYNFVRLDANGNVITVFQPFPYSNACVLNVFPSALQSDGKIVMRGFECFDYYGYDFRGIGRLNIDGSFDDTFNPGEGPNNFVSNIAVQSDDRILLVGYFTEFDGTPVNNIIRLTTERLSSSDYDNTILRVYPNPVADNLYIQYPIDMSDIDIDELEIYDVTMKKMDFEELNKDVIDVSDFSSGVYLLKIKTENSILTSRFVKR